MESETLTKYKSAGDIIHKVVQKLIPLCVDGAKILDICVAGDKAIDDELAGVYSKAVKGVKVSKGVAFPTCISVNNCVAHFSPLASDPVTSAATISNGDVVKIQLGAQIDGYASISAETLIVGATAETPAEGKKADAVKAAWTAAEAAMRLIKAGEKNYTVTDTVGKVVSEFDTFAVEGMLSCQQLQNSIEGKKRIILNPSPEQRRSNEVCTFTEGEVYGMDILVSSGGEGKTRSEDARVTIYLPQVEVTYQLKMKNSRTIFSEIKRKASSFPFNLRILEDEKRARMGISEAVQHGLLRPLEVVYTPADTFVAGFHFTIALLAGGPALLTHPPVWYSADKLKTEKEVKDEAMKELLTRKLRENNKKKNRKAASADEEKAEDAEKEEE
ncbi:Creatinase/aminopeptidase [Dacryopinax primogenitus]|uniref:Creatinase/aminopeptidase n=1 Tax=Dacryopinax primogenitus (strain DJM 731) TaxID=1858805 RepID=M5G833_DACPD|nr:Creatinase/aminopeptidase [Dacryopinax primogenitus]EJU04924.1 Creatinase/aminopeptidase [Dacryopinax primogenitus]